MIRMAIVGFEVYITSIDPTLAVRPPRPILQLDDDYSILLLRRRNIYDSALACVLCVCPPRSTRPAQAEVVGLVGTGSDPGLTRGMETLNRVCERGMRCHVAKKRFVCTYARCEHRSSLM